MMKKKQGSLALSRLALVEVRFPYSYAGIEGYAVGKEEPQPVSRRLASQIHGGRHRTAWP